MLHAVLEALRSSLGTGIKGNVLGVGGMALRTVIIYGFTLVLVRMGSRRFLGKASAFDFIVAIMLGAIMGRSINGSGPLLPTLVAGLVLVVLHWLLALLAFRTAWLGSIIKGTPILLIKEGEVQSEGMRRASITSDDLTGALRLQTNQDDPRKVQFAYLERSGRISVVPQMREPRLWVVSIGEGVQTIRIELQ
jgi:uncharacterized membrane protein YcaP (DUF421 family)